jgi:hypothetical protein
MKRLFALFVIITAITTSCRKNTVKLEYSDIADRLINLKRLAILPEEGEKTAMWSSYDRRSRYNPGNGKYEEWYANGDGANQYIRKEGDDFVLAELEGPGAIVRIWSARPDTGHVKVFIDGMEMPVIDLPFNKYFDHLTAPFNYSGLVYKASEGWNNYIPIPYQKSCKVLAEPGWGVYYHFNYISFPENTKLEPFRMDLSESALEALNRVNEFFTRKLGTSPYPPDQADQVISHEIDLVPGTSVDIAGLSGQYAIKSFKIRPDFEDRKDEMTGLRKIILTMCWDNSPEPAVWTPLGDFFGTTPAINPYKTLPSGMTADEFYSYWYMPFTESGKITLSNQGDKPYHLAYEIVYEAQSIPVDRMAHFHAKWHSDIFPVPEERWPDWTLLVTQGRGRYAGTMLHVMNPDESACKEAAGEGHAWWGEGDEKFFVDGEKFPSTFGTGSEDYFGYAWGNPGLFEKAFHSQSMTSGNKGHQTVCRWHIIDNIPFNKSFEGCIEKYYPNECGTKYNCVVYWYLNRDGIDPLITETVTVDHLIMPPEIIAENNYCLKGDVIVVSFVYDYGSVKYTLDGSEPNDQSRIFSTPLRIKRSLTVKARIYTEDGASGTSSLDLVILDWMEGKEISGLEKGLRYKYYEKDTAWVSLPDFSVMDPIEPGVVEQVNLNPKKREERCGISFSGYIKTDTDGLYRFYLYSDDGSRLYIDNKLIIDNDNCHAATELSAKAALKAGYHLINVEYFENELYQELKLSFDGPGTEKQEVPADRLFH